MAIKIDTTETMEVRETEGIVDYLRRGFLVSVEGSYTDSQVMWECLVHPGLPNAADYAPGNTNLRCLGRQVRLLRNSTHQAEVICEYTPIGKSQGLFIFSGGTSLAQASTQVDRFGNQISVSHTWPEDDEDFPLKTHIQGLDMNVLQPQTTLQASGQLQVAYPDWVSRLWTGSMNSSVWAGAAPCEWMCTRVDFSPLDVGWGRLRQWQFTFEFQHCITGWIPQTWFIDQRTGKPPVGIIPGIGIKSVDWYGLLDFNYLFPIR